MSDLFGNPEDWFSCVAAQIIMKYHPEILYAKYHFVCHVGWHLKIKKCVQKWSKIDQKVLYLWFFWALP